MWTVALGPSEGRSGPLEGRRFGVAVGSQVVPAVREEGSGRRRQGSRRGRRFPVISLSFHNHILRVHVHCTADVLQAVQSELGIASAASALVCRNTAYQQRWQDNRGSSSVRSRSRAAYLRTTMCSMVPGSRSLPYPSVPDCIHLDNWNAPQVTVGALGLRSSEIAVVLEGIMSLMHHDLQRMCPKCHLSY